MLRLLKSEECPNLGEAAQALGYSSWRQCQRWFASYQQGGIEELLKSRVGERARQELLTPEALEDLEEAIAPVRPPTPAQRSVCAPGPRWQLRFRAFLLCPCR
jgi:hypothetical protein